MPLLLDGPHLRGYDDHGAAMAYGTDTFAAVEGTSDELGP